jgi:hypothetical protein
LIEAGILESAVADAIFPEVDGIDPRIEAFRRVSLAAAHMLWHTWHGAPQQAAAWRHRLSNALHAIPIRQLPPVVERTQPEGYSYYSLYPEMYLEAAKRYVAALGTVRAVCLGIRSIGSSLSAVVAATLEELGCSVDSFTLRPRGHPFSRSPHLTDELARFLAANREAHFLLVDEGPGISGSSLAGAAALLHRLGVADDHVELFPAWCSDGSRLRSAVAREHWPRHRQFTCTFEEVWLRSGRLQETFPGELRDASAGSWRDRVLPGGHEYPAVHPQHERRKYLLAPRGSHKHPTKLLSFAGLGAGSRSKVARLQHLADAGFTPTPEKLAHGFMLRSFVPGTPVRRGGSDESLLDFVSSYMAHLYRHQASEPSTSEASIREMVQVNVEEALSNSGLDAQLSRLPRGGWTERPVALDGRMLAHEWIATPGGYLKVDAMDHHDDHFFPGCQDIAWDVVGACTELDLPQGARTYLIDRYRSLSGDLSIRNRLHHFAVAYLAFRVGYVSLAADTLSGSDDGQRFERERRRYRELLCRELSAPEGVCDG